MVPKVSIIIPIYNAEKSIRRCIESVLNQEFKEYELILVNDGSKDQSGEICDEYAAKDARIRVIHKENTGVSDSRNLAISNAKGEYLQFMDSDDWITTDATDLLYHAAKEHNCDMVISDFYRVVGQRLSQKGDIDEDGVMTREEFAEYMMENPADFYYGVLWNKLFKREIIEAHQLRMDSNISWCEDFMFNLEYIRYADRFYALRIPIYYYVKTKGSLASQGMSLTKTIQMKRMVFSYYHKFYKAVFTEEDYEKNRLQVYRFLVDAASDGMVPPTVLLGAKRLGEERNSAVKIDVEGEGILMDEYRDRKLLDRYLEQVALLYDLKLQDVRLLMYLTQPHQITTYKEMVDFTNMSRSKLAVCINRLTAKGYIKIEDVKRLEEKEEKALDKSERKKEKKEKKKKKKEKTERTDKIVITCLPAADAIIQRFTKVESDYEQAKFAGFTEDEMVQYAYLSQKIQKNIQNIL